MDKRFVHLTLLLDQGEEAQGPRWAPQARTFQDLREVLAEAPDPALVLLGPPGSGKSTLLRHFELDNARTVLKASAGDHPTHGPVTFFVALNGFLERSASHGRRCVLVVTGKSGVLKGEVPRWLNQQPNRGRMIALSQAQPRHGGSGALYVLLKRQRGDAP